MSLLTWRRICLGIIGTLLFALLAAGISILAANNGRVARGVCYGSVPLGGMKEKEVRDFFSQLADSCLSKGALNLYYEGQSWHISAADIGLKADVETAVRAAYGVGRGHGWAQNLREQLQSLFYGHNTGLAAHLDDAALMEQLYAVAVAVDKQPIDSFVAIEPDWSLNKVSGYNGYYLDTEKLASQVTPELTALRLPVERELALDEQPPLVTAADIQYIDSVLAAYTTYLGSSPNRNENIRLAASELGGELVRSGDEFSFNAAVGRRVASAGYKTAPVIIEGKLEQDIGGGVCQVSSTLYNAILLAGLTPTVRTSHFFPSAYVPAGLDATVADGQIDFRFRNTLPHNVYLQSSVYGNELTIYILGTAADLEGNTISLETATESVAPAPVVSVYRNWQRGGQTIEHEYLHTDSYSVPEDT